MEEVERRLEGVGPGTKDLLAQAQRSVAGPLGEIRGIVADLIEVRVTEVSSRTVVVNMFHKPNINKLTINNGDHYLFAFGFDGSIAAEPPSRSSTGKSWVYKNLVAEFANR